MFRGQPDRRRVKRLRYALEYCVVRACYALFGALPLDAASALGGWLGRRIGPRLALTERARENLTHAFPDRSEAEVDAIIEGMWDNLGRVLAEYPHLGEIKAFGPGSRITVDGLAHFDLARDDGRGGIVFSAHVANWETGPIAAAQRGLPLMLVYRAPNNPWVGSLLDRARAASQGARVAKGHRGMRTMVGDLKKGAHIAILVDQKYNEGVPIPFFGRPAMTSTAVADLALRLDVPMVPARVERVKGAHFRITVYPAMTPPNDADRRNAAIAMTTAMNQLVEEWVRDRPEQWLWIHRRWPNEPAAAPPKRGQAAHRTS